MIKISKNILNKREISECNYEGDLSDFLIDELRDEFEAGHQIKVIVNKSLLSVEEYDIVVSNDDEVYIIIVPAAAGILIPFLINIAISIAIALILKFFFTPDTDAIEDKGGSLDSLTFGEISLKKDGAIDEYFGTSVVYPRLIAPIYKKFINNEEVTFITTCIGEGEYTFDDLIVNKERANEVLMADGNPVACDGISSDGVITCLNNKQNHLNVVRFDKNVSSFYFPGDSTYRYLVHELGEFQNFSLIDFDEDATGKWTKPSALTFRHAIDKVEIDIQTLDGLYRIDDDGDSHSTTIAFKYRIYKLDHSGNEINAIENIWRRTAETGKKWRGTLEINVPEGTGWMIKFKNLTRKSGTEETVVNGYNIVRVKGLTTFNTVNTEGLTYAIFRLKTGEVFKENTQLKIGIRASRVGLKRMNDVINYIWTSTGYDKVELAETNTLLSQYEVNGGLTAKEPLYNQINRILRAQEIMIIPTLNGFRVKKETVIEPLTYVFDKSKMVKGSLEISGTLFKNQENDGFKSVFVNWDGDKQEEVYPPTARNPKSVELTGVNDKYIARNHSIIGYNKMIKQNKTATFTAELESYIPEIGDKIGIVEYYINESSTANVRYFNSNIFKLDKEVLLNGTNDYCIIRSENTSLDSTYKIVNSVEGFTDEVEIEGFYPTDTVNQIALIIGEEKSIMKEYILMEITSKDGLAELSCQNYDETIYNQPLYVE